MQFRAVNQKSLNHPFLPGSLKTAEKWFSGRSRPGKAEYLLIIYPDPDMREKLLDEQQQFLHDYGLPVSVRNKPHITVGSFRAEEQMEATLIRWIQRICSLQKSFDVTLNNYSGFPPHTIYLRVQDPEPFRQLTGQLLAVNDYICSCGWPAAEFSSRPFVSIAGSLTEQVYSRAMPAYSRKTFHDVFSVSELVLLKREHTFDACKTVNIFRFAPVS